MGAPQEPGTLLGPLIDAQAFEAMQAALAQARAEGGQVSGVERALQERFPNAFYVRAALVEMSAQATVVQRETFVPILYVLKYRRLPRRLA